MGSDRRKPHVHSWRLRHHLRPRRELHRLPGAAGVHLAQLHDREPGDDGRRAPSRAGHRGDGALDAEHHPGEEQDGGAREPADVRRNRSPVHSRSRPQRRQRPPGCATYLHRLNANYLNTQPNPDVRVLTPNYGDIVLWDDFAKAKYDAVMMSVNYRRGRLLSNLAYTLGWAKADYDAVTAPAFAFRSSYNMQETIGDERHRLVLSEVADFEWLGGLQIAGIVSLASPRPFGASIGQDLNFDNDFADDFFPDGSPSGSRTIRPDNDFKNWYRNVDLRLGKSLFTAQGRTVRLTAEVFNVFNTDNVAAFGGRQKTAAGVDITNFGQPTGAFGARRAQVGARFEF